MSEAADVKAWES